MMNVKRVFLLCGVPGSGKSTWIRKQVQDTAYECKIISRDEIRFSMLNDEDEYFAKEDAVFEEFIRQIQEAIDGTPQAIFIDATHLNEKGRNKVLDLLNLENCKLYPVSFEMPLDVCLSQNAQRTGRARVPQSVVKRMFYQYVPPKDGEKYFYEHILHVMGR